MAEIHIRNNVCEIFGQGGDTTQLDDPGVARIVRQCGSAIQFLHERNVAHRQVFWIKLKKQLIQ
jgi:serine/threonine protein kinase